MLFSLRAKLLLGVNNEWSQEDLKAGVSVILVKEDFLLRMFDRVILKAVFTRRFCGFGEKLKQPRLKAYPLGK